jgi:hypothetical protein
VNALSLPEKVAVLLAIVALLTAILPFVTAFLQWRSFVIAQRALHAAIAAWKEGFKRTD